MRRIAAAVVLAVAGALLAGCATIPTSGSVQTPPPTAPAGESDIVTQPNPPAAGANPEQIVGGFVQALSEGRDYSVARQFLTADAADGWRPNERVVVHQQKWDVALTGTNRVVLTVPETGEVDADGLYTPKTGTVALTFDLQQVRGQWRISTAPDEVVLAQFVFQRVFQPVELQFFDPGFARYVPDLRWFPRRADQAPAIVSAVLNGRVAPLSGGATASAFPDGTRLARAVGVSDGVVAAAVTTPGGVDERTRGRMQQQLATTLALAGFAALDLVVDGQAAPRTGEADVESPAIGDPPAVLVDGRFGALRSSGFTEDRTLGPRIAAARPSAVTVSARQRLAAVLTGSGDVAVITPSASKIVDTRAGLVAPTLDQRGWTFSVPAGDPGGLRASQAGGAVKDLRTDLTGTGVVSIQASWDGTRMLVVVDTDRGTSAYVAGIERDGDGAPTGLTTAHYPVQLGGALAGDATWITPTTVGVLTGAGGNAGGQTVVAQQLGGPPSRLGPLSNARAVVGGSVVEELRALLESGDLQVQSGNGWQREFADPVQVQVLAVQR